MLESELTRWLMPRTDSIGHSVRVTITCILIPCDDFKKHMYEFLKF